MRLFLLSIFALSGAAGLIYESIWARYLGLFVGHSSFARILVLTIFLGGMALGALAVSRRTEKLSDPLRVYALAELALAVVALFFHEIFQWATTFSYDSIFPLVAGGPALTILKWTIAGTLILPQAIVLGTTFPLMAAGVIRRYPDNPGRTLSLLYFTNSMGAATGVLVAGFYLVSAVGLPGTLLFAGGLNLAVAIACYLVAARGTVSSAPTPRPERGLAVSVREDYTHIRGLVPILLAVSFGTALASFVYEISWLRMLSLVLGSTTRSFDLMLSAFILGLALGSFWVRERSDRWGRPIRALGTVQVAMGLAALLTIPLYMSSFRWMGELIGMFAKTDNGFTGFTMARYGISVIVMVPSTFCAGITLPLITRILFSSGSGERAIGSVYGYNTLGSILGVVIAGLIALPVLGLKNLLIAGTVIDIGLGIWILSLVARSPEERRFTYGHAAVSAAVLSLIFFGTTFEPVVMSSGVYRHGRSFNPQIQSVFHEDGRTATVSVHNSPSVVTIKTNGKADASLTPAWLEQCTDSTVRRPMSGDATTQTLLAVIPMGHNPAARHAAVIGHGSGLTSHTLLSNASLETVTTIEIEPEIISGSRQFYPANSRVFDDPRSRIVIQDARTHFAAENELYDLIVSEPSNPWVSGVASLFTTEFYGHVRRYMAEDGVFAQWLQLYEMDDALVLSILSALHANFPDYQIFLLDDVDLVIVATNAERLAGPDWDAAVPQDLRADLCHTQPLTAETLDATRLIDRRSLAPLLDGWGQSNSEFYPTLDLGAERARYLGAGATGIVELGLDRFNFTNGFIRRPVGPARELTTTLATNSLAAIRARGAIMHAFRAGSLPEASSAGHGAREAVGRWEQLSNAANSSRPPSNWRDWTALALAVENDFNGGTSGVVDEELFQMFGDFMDEHGAPQHARSAIGFRRALAGWDFGGASTTADSLVSEAMMGTDWVPVEELLAGGIAAKILSSDVPGARELLDQIGPRLLRNGFSVRLALAESYVRVFETLD